MPTYEGIRDLSPVGTILFGVFFAGIGFLYGVFLRTKAGEAIFPPRGIRKYKAAARWLRSITLGTATLMVVTGLILAVWGLLRLAIS